MAKPIKRGALIVLEGCDRTGKSTQSQNLHKFLQSQNIKVQRMVFPERTTNIGKVINSYLSSKQELSDEVIHLLFTTNRWEFKNQISRLLCEGTTLVVDRYSYSGIAYSVAKGLDFDWCSKPEKGLIQPDAVFYLKAPVESLLKRGNYGEERYEKEEFQRKVSDVFDQIHQEEQKYWHVIDATSSKDHQSEVISKKALEVIEDVAEKPLMFL